MRMMLKATMPVDAGNEAIRSGKLQKTLDQVMAELKPEAAYFLAEGGQRTALLVINMENPSQIPPAVEPFFLAVNAKVELIPCMNGDDLQKGLSGLQDIIKRYG
jgi:hypothetical protein